jgi:dihydrofolate synthase/folylpolyglutamate synthase
MILKIKDIDEAEAFIYSSYLKAEKYLDYNLPDKLKRNPEFTRYILNQTGYVDAQTNILVTGSKGKGSVSVMISEILQTCFEKVGLFTGPAISVINERIRINKKLIDDDCMVRYANFLLPYVKEIEQSRPVNKYVSPIGILLIMALLFFKDTGTDINILECGKGALYDDVNIVNRDYSVINTILLEHQRELGKTIQEIAEDKSAVIKSGQKYAYTARQQESVMEILEARAKRYGVQLKSYGKDFYCWDVTVSREGTRFNVYTKNGVYNDISLPLLGEHQAYNCALALAVCEDITGSLDEVKVKNALKNISWPGRLEIIAYNPVTILDACINRSSAVYVKKVLALMNPKQVITIIGIPQDKDYEGVVEEMGDISGKIILTTSKNPHYRFSEEQLNNSLKYRRDCLFIKNADEALDYAKKHICDQGIVCILGTTALVSEVKSIYKAVT